MQPVKLKDENLNLEDSYISLVNKETQTDATDSFLENYYLRFHRSQNSSAIQSEHSLKLLGCCRKRGEGGTVTIKDNTIIIKEPFRRNPPSLIENISQNTGPSGKSAYCEEVLIPYLKTPPPDCQLYERLAIEFSEETPDYQPDSSTNQKDMKDMKTNSGGKCENQDTTAPCEKPETTELTDLGRGLEKVASALFTPICQNCEAKKADDAKAQDANDPCKKTSSSQQLLDAVSTVSHGIKKVASKMMTAVCPNKTSDQSAAPPPNKSPKTPPPEPEITKSDSTSSVKGAYTACKKKTICIAKGVRSSLSNLLCTPCPCPKNCEPCSSPTATPIGDDQADGPPKEDESATGHFVEETVNCSNEKAEEGPPPCPVVTELPPCPPPEEKLPCQPKDVELPPCPKKVIEKPPCPPQEDKPYCPPPKKKEKKCPPKQGTCVPVSKCKIKDPVMAVRMPKCKGEKPLYYITDRSKICKNCLEKSNDESMDNKSTENVSFDATGIDKMELPTNVENNFDRESFHSLKHMNITGLNNEMELNDVTKPNSVHGSDALPNLDNGSSVVTKTDVNSEKTKPNNENVTTLEQKNDALSNLENQSNSESFSQSNNLPRVIPVSNEIKCNDTEPNSENVSSINTEPSTHSSKIAHVVSLNNELKSNSHVNIDIEKNDDQGFDFKVRLGKPVVENKDSMSYLVHTVHRTNEPTPVLSEESQLIKVTETASTEKKFPNVKNVNRGYDAVDDENSESEESEASAIERASMMMAPIVTRLASAVDSTMTSLKERFDLDRFSSTIKENVRETTEQSSTYDKFDKRSNMSVPAKELSNTDSASTPDGPSSLTKSVFTTIKSKLFGMFSDRERTEDSNGPVLERTSKASVRFKNSDGTLD